VLLFWAHVISCVLMGLSRLERPLGHLVHVADREQDLRFLETSLNTLIRLNVVIDFLLHLKLW
jgi:hypothetical protein